MNSHARFAKATRPIEVALVGAGAFGRSLLGQGRRMALMNVRVAVDLSADRAAQAFLALGYREHDLARCETRAEAQAAWDSGKMIAVGALDAVLGLPVDIVVEASGHPEAGAVHALAALEAGKHVALVTKESDSVVGSYLAAVARDRGLVCTTADGDQPALLIGLVTWAETLGLPIIAAGKSSEYDFVFDAATETMTSDARSAPTPGFGGLWERGDRPVAELVAERSRRAAALPQLAVPDLCEMAVVANATGLKPDVPPFHAPIARIAEVADILEETARGGLLGGTRRLDVFNCLRAKGDISFAGGVFVVVRCEDEETWSVLAGKGHVMSRSGQAAMLWIPRHLLGLEAPITLLDAVVNGVSVAGRPKPLVDLVGRATRPLARGTRLAAEGHHHTIDGVGPELIDAAPLSPARPAPYYLIADRILSRDLPAGAPVTLADVEMDEHAPLFVMRRRQDAMFFG
jgi:predicted homoserine dehydrogenase-like protein